MSLLNYPLTIPPKTRPTAPLRMTISTGVGHLVKGSLLFPTGCVGLVGVRLFDQGVQIAPYPVGWLIGNGNPPIAWTENPVRKLQGGNYYLVVEGYNMARDWPHTVQVQLEIV